MKQNFLAGVATMIIANLSKRDSYVAEVSRDIVVSYSHTTKIIDKLTKEDILIKTKEGRKIKVELTEKGKKIHWHIKSIEALL